MLETLNSSWNKRIKADGAGHVVDQRGDGRHRELPFEAEPDIDEDAKKGDDHGDRTAGDQLAGNGRADDLDAAIFDRIAERLLNLGDRRLLLLLGRLRGDANEHGIGRAEFLDLNFADAEPVYLAANVGEIGRALLGLDLDQRAALEIDAHIQADGRDENERHHGQKTPRRST